MIQQLLRKIVFCSVILFISFMSHAQDLNIPLPIDPSVTVGKLPNGLKYYIKSNALPDHKVELRLMVNAGSILETDQQQGLAHFMEHMNFNGTKRYPKNALMDFLQSIGVQFGADLNAYTSFDETVFILPIPTDKPDNLDKGFQMLSDWAQGASLTDQNINEERKVVLEESRNGKGAEDRMMRQYLPKLLAGSHYADRLPIGKDNIIKTFKPATIRSFYNDWYRPDLMAVAVVGSITPEEGKGLVEHYFAGLKNPVNEKPRALYEVPAFKSQEALALSDKEATQKGYSIVFSPRKLQKELNLKDYRTAMIRKLFIQMLNSRLQELSQSAKPSFVYSYAYVEGWARGYEGFQIVGSASGDMDTAISASVAELVRIEQYGFTASELLMAKKKLLAAVEKRYKERKTTESGRIISDYVRHFLTEEPIPGIENEFKYNKELLPGISLKEANSEAYKWLSDHETFFAMTMGPEPRENKKMSNQELLAIVQKAFQQKVEPRVEKITATALLDKEPVPGKIVAAQKDDQLGITTFTMSNGIKVTVKPTTFKSDEIVMNGLKMGGQGQYSIEDKSNATMMTQVVEAMGYGKFTPTDLKDFLSGKVVSVSNSMGAVTDNINASSSVNDFETMLQLVYLKLTAAHKNEELFQGFMTKQKASLEFVKSNPQYAFFDTINKTLYNNDLRAPITIPTIQDMDKINADRVLEMFHNEYGNADGFNFYIVGNVSVDTIKPLLEKYIASLPVKGTTPVYKDNGLRPVSGNHELKFNKGKEQKSIILEQYYGAIPFSEDLEFKAHMVTDILNIRIIEELREKIGGIYSGGMAADVRKVPYSRYQVQLYLPCGPESVDTLLKAADMEIATIKKNGPSEKDLTKVKQAQLEQYRENVKKNNYWSASLQGILFWGNDKQRFLDYERIINTVSVIEIKEAANLLFDGKNTLKSILYPQIIEVKN